MLCTISGMAQAPNSADTVYTSTLREVKITARWKNDTARYRYNQMKFYVTTVLPYVNATTLIFNDINTKTKNVSNRERRRYIATKQNEMRDEFEDKLKSLNVTQGVLLVKLIARQTNLNIYDMVLEIKNPIVALKWQTWARLNGMNLNRKYHPEDEPDLENIMYELGYPLPASYASN